jgi:hypothetical protein
MLADLVAGPRAEVLALWTASASVAAGPVSPPRRAIEAAWGHYGRHGEALFAAPETVAAPGPNGTPGAAIDPRSDEALAAWVAGARTPRLQFARRAPGPPAHAAPASSSAARPLLFGLPAAALLLLLGGAARRRGLRRWGSRARARPG